ncbi:hypothetical protein CSB20_03895 [bacterium DOLZORAL124_64_63]|nr:MAG: hypothetical protein CSB20_03895 [bacterium DOLZORAL124_64_63]
MGESSRSPISSLENLKHALEEAQRQANQEYGHLQEYLEQARETDTLYQGIFHGSQDALFILAAHSGRIRRVNRAGCALLGQDEAEVLGQSPADYFVAEDREAYLAAYHQVQATGAYEDFRGRMRGAGGRDVPVLVSAVHLEDQTEDRVVVFVREISAFVAERTELEGRNAALESTLAERAEEIQQALAALEKSKAEANRNAREAHAVNKAKGRFVANMSHEIRTPLNAVIGTMELLVGMDLDEKQKETALIAQRSANALVSVVNDLLDFSKLEAGKLELEKTVFVLPDLIQTVADTFRFQARQKGLDLNLASLDNLPEFVLGDPGRLRQVLVNLISNAVKFTRKGHVALSVELEEEEGRQATVRFAVRDTGVGIDAKRLGGIFDSFTQAAPAETREFGGTGLGLAITRQLVTLMGGEMQVSSVKGEGSEFGFTVVLDLASGEQVVPQKQEEGDEQETDWRESAGRKSSGAEITGSEIVGPEAGGQELSAREEHDQEETAPWATPDRHALRVLLVEDNIVNQKVAVGILSKQGFPVQAAGGGQEALEMLAEETFDLVFMDIEMPGLDGLETTRKIRAGEAGEAGRDVPIIAMATHATSQERKDCLVAGMNDYMVKPIRGELIHETIRRVLDGLTHEPDPVDSTPFSMARLIQKMDGDVELATEILTVFMNDSRQRLKIITGALENYDFAFATQEAQSLEGGALNVDAGNIVTMVQDLVQATREKQQDRAADLVRDLAEELDGIDCLV